MGRRRLVNEYQWTPQVVLAVSNPKTKEQKDTAASFPSCFKRTGKLFCRDHEGRALEVVPTTKVAKVLKAVYEDVGTFTGRDSMYNYVKTRYAGISRRSVAQFIKNNQNTQIHKPRPRLG